MTIRLFDFDKNNLVKPAIVYQENVINFARLLKKTDAISYLIDEFFIEGRIGICMGNEPLFISILLGIHNLERSAVLLNSQSKTPELKQQITQLNLEYLLISEATAALFDQNSFAAETICQLKDNEFGTLQVWKIHKTHASIVKAVESKKPVDKEFIVSFTSGVSGNSRIVSRSYTNFQIELEGLFDAFKYTKNDKFVCPAPVFHAYGLVNGVLAALKANACITLIPEFIPNQVLEIIKSSKATVFVGVPLMYSLLNETFGEEIPDISSLRACLSAGAKLDIEIAMEFKQKFGIPINQLYGSTETGAVAANLFKDGFSDFQSVGQVFQGAKIVLVNSEGEELEAGQEGSIKINSEAITEGYLNESTLNKQLFKDGWYFPEDMGRFDKEGNLTVTGRTSSFINVAGKKVDPFEIEQVLLQIEGLEECVVIGIPDAQVEEVIVAAIVLSKPISESSIIKFCIERLTHYKIPKKICFLDGLPRTAVGKILKNQLKEQLIKQFSVRTSQFQSNKPAFRELNPTQKITSETRLKIEAIEKITATIRNLLYLDDQIEADKPFSELGIDSILITQFANELSVFYSIDLSPSAFYIYPTAQELAAFLVSDYSVQLAGKHATVISSGQQATPVSPAIISTSTSKQLGITFNRNASPTIFFFPAFFGLAIGYQKLAATCTQTRFYCFDFIESENRMDSYYQQIKQQQPTGPYILFGYSAGGNLAYEAARYLESKGEVVSDIIFADSYIEPSMSPFDFEEFMEKSKKKHYLPEQIKYLVENKTAYEKTKQRTTAFYYFLSHMKMKPIIQANIHNLLAVDDGTRDSVSFNWAPYTEGEYKTYVAKGFHADLLISPYLSVTAGLLNNILEQIEIRSQQCA